MSEPDVPTDRLLTMTVPLPSLMRAIAAVPPAPATPDFGAPAIVMTPPASVKLGFDNAMLHRTVANAAGVYVDRASHARIDGGNDCLHSDDFNVEAQFTDMVVVPMRLVYRLP
jgi:hypothetical protein